jgi:hypothetical protein
VNAKFLERSLIVAGASLFFKLATALAPHVLHVQVYIRYWNNAVLVAALGLAVASTLSIVIREGRFPKPGMESFLVAIFLVFSVAMWTFSVWNWWDREHSTPSLHSSDVEQPDR